MKCTSNILPWRAKPGEKELKMDGNSKKYVLNQALYRMWLYNKLGEALKAATKITTKTKKGWKERLLKIHLGNLLL